MKRQLMVGFFMAFAAFGAIAQTGTTQKTKKTMSNKTTDGKMMDQSDSTTTTMHKKWSGSGRKGMGKMHHKAKTDSTGMEGSMGTNSTDSL